MPFECPLCFLTFKRRIEVAAHARTHTSEKPWQCEICHACFKFSSSLKSHRMLKHEECTKDDKAHRCGQCDYQTTRNSILQNHLRSHSKDRPFTCSMHGCSKKFKKAQSLKRHELYNHDEDNLLATYGCPQPGCRYSAKRKDQVQYHLKSVHGPSKELPCSLSDCSYVAKSHALLKQHLRSHEEKEFKCKFSQCQDSFKTERGLKRHESVHDLSRPFACDLCPYRGNGEGMILTHKKLRHEADAEVKSYICPFCMYSSKLVSTLKTHIKLRHQAEPFICPEKGCPYRSLSDEMLRSHRKRMHDPASNIVCRLCSYRFKTQHNLQLHTRTVHEGKKDCQCPQCEFRATTKFKVDRHVQSKHVTTMLSSTTFRGKPKLEILRPATASELATMETETSCPVPAAQPFYCQEPDCGHLSYSRSAFDMHMKLHCNERKFPCQLCSLRFSDNAKLARHVNTIHEEGPSFICTQSGCDFQTYSQYNLEYHTKFHDESRPFACHLCPMRFEYKVALKVHLKSLLTHSKRRLKER